MLNRSKFKATAIEHGVTMQQIATFLRISLPTLYRKMNGESDFTRNEIQLYRQMFGLSSDECDDIFLKPNLCKRKKPTPPSDGGRKEGEKWK